MDRLVTNLRLLTTLTQLQQQEDRLLNLRLLEETSTDTFAKKSTELRDRIADVALKMDATNRDRLICTGGFSR